MYRALELILAFIIVIILAMSGAAKTGGNAPAPTNFMATLAAKFASRDHFFAREDRSLLAFVDKSTRRPGDFMFTPEGLISISPPSRARELADIIERHYRGNIADATITDATACNGGDTICFARRFKCVNAVEINPANYAALTHNVALYSLDNVTTHLADYLDVLATLKQDIVHIDAPWTGVDYKQVAALRLKLGDVYLEDIVARLLALPTPPHISLKVPKNFDKDSLRRSLPQSADMIVDDIRKFDLITILAR